MAARAEDEVTRAMAAAKKVDAAAPSAAARVWSWTYKHLLSRVLPKRKTVVRSALFALIGTLPMFVLLAFLRPVVMVPLLAVVGGTLYLLGAGEEVGKQLRWMKRMSQRGPIFWMLDRLNRLSVRVARQVYGAKLDVLPKAPSALGTTARGAERAVIKWIATPTSQYSQETFDVQMRHVPRGEATETEVKWIELIEEMAALDLELKPLTPDVDYEVRVRAVNSKGASDWRTLCFTTKQQPLKSADGERAGGHGPGYSWSQNLKDDSMSVTIGLPSGTRAKQLEVAVMPTTLSVRLALPKGDEVLLSGDLFGSVSSEDVEWELQDTPGGGGARELHLQLTKTGKSAGNGPFWPHLIKGHPEIDVSGLKRMEKDLNEMLADLSKSTGMHAMDGIQYAKSVREGAGI